MGVIDEENDLLSFAEEGKRFFNEAFFATEERSGEIDGRGLAKDLKNV